MKERFLTVVVVDEARGFIAMEDEDGELVLVRIDADTIVGNPISKGGNKKKGR